MNTHQFRPKRTPMHLRIITWLALLVCLGASVPAAGLTLEHWTHPEHGSLAGGDGQTGIVGREFPEPLKVFVRGEDGGPPQVPRWCSNWSPPRFIRWAS